MRAVFLIVLFQLILSSFLGAQHFEMTILEKEDISGLNIVETNYFFGKGLYGHINGGAELFHEYGFESLAVHKIEKDQSEIVVEIYKMKDPNAAFGIFSVSKNSSVSMDTTSYLSCFTPYHNLICRGNYYISIVNYSKGKNTQMFSRKIYETLKNKIDMDDFKYPEVFNKKVFKKYKNRIKLITGTLALQKNIAHFEGLFNNINNYKIYYIDAENQNELLLIQFANKDNIKMFLKGVGFTEIKIETGNIEFLIKDNKHYAARILENKRLFLSVSNSEDFELKKTLFK